ncbi:DNA cytosine methyltransferase [Nocardia cyriacigeorgica]|nr:DNA cytosine methyltransferase [Nocardia cyriacigeorgica]MBF6402459.1 DNA cytosine methyltransferase [Nocardia cyriacigeorgica]
MLVGSLCTGYGGLDIGILAAFGGGRLAWCADPDPYIRQILSARMPDTPNLGDLREIDWASIEPVDILSAGFPCQDISCAGPRLGIDKGTRSGLWTEIMAGIRLLRPPLLVVENVAALRGRRGGMHRVLADLAQAGYDTAWRSLHASDIGAPHRRDRVFLLAWPTPETPADTPSPRRRPPRTRRPNPTTKTRTPSRTPRRRPRTPDTTSPPAPPQDVELKPAPPGGPFRLLPTPRATDTGTPGRRAGRGFRPPLSEKVLPLATGTPLLPTPRAIDGTKGSPAQHGSSGDLMLPSAIAHHTATGEPSARTTLRQAGNLPSSAVDWVHYTPAIRRWEAALGRPAPHPTQPGLRGSTVLAPAFVEWMMGLPEGWVTDLDLPRNAQLRALGNGVVPQQAAYAISMLHTDFQDRSVTGEKGDPA